MTNTTTVVTVFQLLGGRDVLAVRQSGKSVRAFSTVLLTHTITKLAGAAATGLIKGRPILAETNEERWADFALQLAQALGDYLGPWHASCPGRAIRELEIGGARGEEWTKKPTLLSLPVTTVNFTTFVKLCQDFGGDERLLYAILTFGQTFPRFILGQY